MQLAATAASTSGHHKRVTFHAVRESSKYSSGAAEEMSDQVENRPLWCFFIRKKQEDETVETQCC
jgi:hypothetical protein